MGRKELSRRVHDHVDLLQRSLEALDDLLVEETDQKNFCRGARKINPVIRKKYLETIDDNEEEDEDIDESLLERLRTQLERANHTIVSMQNKEKMQN